MKLLITKAIAMQAHVADDYLGKLIGLLAASLTVDS